MTEELVEFSSILLDIMEASRSCMWFISGWMVEDTHPGFIIVLGQVIGIEKIEGDHEFSKR